MKYIFKLQKFMYGRYGFDELYKFLLRLCILVLLVNLFIRHYILLIMEILILFFMFYRIISKKIYRRQKENIKYLKIKNKILTPFENIKRNIQDKNHIYKKCRHCNKILKLPLPEKKGIKHVKCPNCKRKMKILVLKKQKIEIIKKTRKTS